MPPLLKVHNNNNNKSVSDPLKSASLVAFYLQPVSVSVFDVDSVAHRSYYKQTTRGNADSNAQNEMNIIQKRFNAR